MTGALRLVVFDVDGTLIDSQDHICAAMARAFATTGHAMPSREKILSIVGLSLPEAMAALVPDLPLRDRDAVVAGYKQSFGVLRSDSFAPLYPGAADALNSLAHYDEVLLGLATGKSRRGLDHVLGSHDLGRYFVTAQVADDHPSKPHPSMLNTALAETGVCVGNAVMIGDTSYDIEMGRRAGFCTIGVGWGYHRPESLVDAGADEVIMDYAALLPALERIWGKR